MNNNVMTQSDTAAWTAEDRFNLSNLRVPVPQNEQKRIETLRKSKLLETTAASEAGFSRFISLLKHVYEVPYCAISFIEVDRIIFKSKYGLDYAELSRNDWFDSYAILEDSHEVFVVQDCSTDERFRNNPFVKNHPFIRFYAGTAIVVDNTKIGVVSVMDTKPHVWTLAEKENLLDIGASASQLAREKLQTALNLSAERANIVVSMMHHLRTPMTSLNFATSLLCNDVSEIRPDGTVVPAGQQPFSPTGVTMPNSLSNSESVSNPTSTKIASSSSNDMSERKASESPPPNVFNTFESSFQEICNALSQLNILVDSSLSLGQAIIKCSQSELVSSSNTPSADPRSRFTECNIIDYLMGVFKNNLPVYNNSLEIEWIINTVDLLKGTHVTFPDAVMLIVISTISHMSAENNSIGFYFTFDFCNEDELEYPDLLNKILEGRLVLRIFSKDKREDKHGNEEADLLSKQNFLSIDKILRAILGSSREYVDNIVPFTSWSADHPAEMRTIHEFSVPCKIMLPVNEHGVVTIPNIRSDRTLLKFYRGPNSKNSGASNSEKMVTTMIHEVTPRNNMPTTRGDENDNGSAKATEVKVNPASLVQRGMIAHPTEEKVNSPTVKPLRVLVIEDTIPVQKLLTRWLQNQGCLVACAANGRIGLDLLTTSPFDIAFVDFLMPIMMGCAMMKEFQMFIQDHAAESDTIAHYNKDLLIVGMSATALDVEQEEAFSYGMHFFCPKPVSLELLCIILNAKRAFPTNEAAINNICELTGTNANDSYEIQHENGDTQYVAYDSRSSDSADSKDQSHTHALSNTNRKNWTFFRSLKQHNRYRGNSTEDGDQENDAK